MKKILLLITVFFIASLQCFSESGQSKMLIKHCEQNLEVEQYLKQKNKNFQGCAQGTLIKTPFGYVSIEQLQHGDMIASVEGDQEIIDIKKATLGQIVCVRINGICIYVSKNEQFFLEDGSLKSAIDLELGDCLQGGGCVDMIFSIDEPCDCYRLTTEQHGYFIYPNVYVHNFDMALLTAPSLLIGVLEIVNPVTLLIGIIVPLSIYAVDYYIKHKNCNSQQIAVDDLQEALQDVQSVQQTRNYYELKRKELYSLYQDLFSIYNELKLLIKSNQNVVTFSNSLLSQFQLNPYNLLPLPNLSVECGYSVVDKQKLLIIRDQELQNLEAKIIDLEVVLAFHINELIEQRDESQKALKLFMDEIYKQVNMWNFDLYNISNDVAITNYTAHLKELELLNNLEQKVNEISFITAYYDRLKSNKILSHSTNISTVIRNQIALNNSVKSYIASLRATMFSNMYISENLLRSRGLLSLQDINAVRSVVKR